MDKTPYANEVVFLIEGKFVSTISEVIESIIFYIGLEVNLIITKLVLFARKYKFMFLDNFFTLELLEE